LTISSVALTVGAVSTTVMTAPVLATSTKTYQQDTSLSFSADVYAKLDAVTYQVEENVFTQKSIDLSCSSGGVTSISYTLGTYGGGPIPSWVSLDSSAGMLIIDKPIVGVTTSFSFSVDNTFNGTTDYKPVTIQVIAA